MSDAIPLGKREDLHLEFKSADSLKDPEKIAREVVAMLNAGGGEVWVGLGEEEERAVLVESIPDAERESRRLHDYLVDVIEPPPDAQEVRVSIRESDEGKNLLCIETMPSSDRKPYAFLRKGGRFYVTRVGARIRPMTRDEIFSRRSTDRDGGIGLAEKKILSAREEVLASGRQVLWLRFEPGRQVSLDIQASSLNQVIQDPRASGNIPAGWHFSQFLTQPQIQQDVLVADDQLRRVEVGRNGGLVFSALLEALEMPAFRRAFRLEENEIFPPAFVEYIVSAFKMARVIYLDLLHPQDAVVVDLILTGARGLKLRAGVYSQVKALQSEDFVLTKPLRFPFREIAEDSESCGYRLIERVYEAFGLRREDIPKLSPE